ncbi:MAG: alpha/beta fold hydrolase [Syntrophaceae bacterium]|nr:alpha/beta fold hydrolase [Syntrophaceae bacterium]
MQRTEGAGRSAGMNPLRLLSLLLMAVAVLNGCALFTLRKDNTFSQDSCLITGEVYAGEAVKRPILVVAFEKVDGRVEIAHYAMLHEPGPYELLVRKGRYHVFAFEDADRNRKLDPGELAGIVLGDGPGLSIDAPAGGLVPDMAVVLSRDPEIRRQVPADILARSAAGGFGRHSTQAGAPIDLNDPAFSAEEGVRGFWSPLEFFREHGANIYFLEPYDPRKIPILLVHGAAGSPQDWRYFIDHLDRSRYQPWIYSYPSGARLKGMSELMAVKIHHLHRKYGFERLYITAHSMGGHVARFALAHGEIGKPDMKLLFVSISTPFGGEELAETGVSQSPAVIPSWKDMVPNSEFIRLSFSRKMPPTIPDYLFFGHRGSRNPLRPNNDNTVTLESMLDPRAQSEAIKVFGFNEDHVGILNSAAVMAQYKAILEGVEKRDADPGRANRKGKVRFRYAVGEASDAPPLWMWLMFIPADTSRAEFTLSPDPLKADQEMGPIRAGAYDVGLLAWGYRVSPAGVKADVAPGGTAQVSLSLEPQGMVGGRITTGLKKDDRYWGFMPYVANSRITSISLTGGGAQRKIVPRPATRGEAIRSVMDNRDFFWKDFFIFFDLPKGRYELRIEAQGFRPFVQAVTVDPKIIHAPLKIALSPLD